MCGPICGSARRASTRNQPPTRGGTLASMAPAGRGGCPGRRRGRLASTVVDIRSLAGARLAAGADAWSYRAGDSSFEVLCGDGGGEGVGELVDLFEEVGEDALGFLAAAGCGEFGCDGAEQVEG